MIQKDKEWCETLCKLEEHVHKSLDDYHKDTIKHMTGTVYNIGISLLEIWHQQQLSQCLKLQALSIAVSMSGKRWTINQ